ncbi:MAG: DMT family transporter [Bacteroidales bacterium]|nr:DMT family transporter [Bacteroidales bacterium]
MFVAIFSMIFLKEKLSIWGWLAIFGGFAGIALVFDPSFEGSLKTNLLGICNGFLAGAAYTSVRELKKHYDSRAIVLSFIAWGILLPGLSMVIYVFYPNPAYDFIISPFGWPSGIYWFYGLMVGITAYAGQILLTRAYGYEKAGVVSTVGYINIPFAIGLGYLMGDKIPGPNVIMGIVLIVASGIVISIRRNI